MVRDGAKEPTSRIFLALSIPHHFFRRRRCAMIISLNLCRSSAVFAIFGTRGFGRELIRPAREMLKDRADELVFVTDDPQGPVLGIPVLSPDQLGPTDE